MQTYEILVKERSVLPNSADMTLVRTSIGIDQVHVMFDNSEWLAFPVSITFGNGETVVTQSLTTSALTDIDGWVAEGTCVIPWEVTQDLGAIRVTLQGADSSGNHIITAYGAPLTVEECGDTASGTVPQPAPSQSEWEQAYADAQTAINALTSKLAECDAAIAAMQAYVPTKATSSSLGLVQPDNETIEVDDNGIISAVNGYTLPTAASNKLGGVQVGNTLQINEFGTLNVSDEISEAQEVTDMAFDVTETSGEITAVTLKSTALPDEAQDYIEAYYYNGAMYEESSHTTAITGVEGKLYVDISTGNLYRYASSAYTQVATYSLPTAGASTLGGVKVGNGLAIDANGVLSVDIPDGDSVSY